MSVFYIFDFILKDSAELSRYLCEREQTTVFLGERLSDEQTWKSGK